MVTREPFGTARRKAQELLKFLTLDRFQDEQKLLEPGLILLDEPAAGVNRTLLNELLGAITQLRDGDKTVLIVEHDMKVQADARVIEAYFGR